MTPKTSSEKNKAVTWRESGREESWENHPSTTRRRNYTFIVESKIFEALDISDPL